MPQKLSALKYILNNKRRVLVLLFSLAMCAVLFYVADFLLNVSTETYRVILIDGRQKVQQIQLSSDTLDVDTEVEYQEWLKLYEKANLELVEELKGVEGVEDVFFSMRRTTSISAVVGVYSLDMPMLDRDEVPVYMEHMGAKLIDGRMPENDNELIFDEKVMKNRGFTLGQELNNYKIVGVVECEYYFCCGVNEHDMDNSAVITILTDGSIEDMEAVVKDLGYDVDREHETIYDLVEGRESLQKDIIDAIETSTNMVYFAIVVILSIAIIVVYVTYLRDRYNEWCLYCSIGFSRKEIYWSVMRELFITFGTAVVLGAVVSFVTMVVLDCTLVASLGLRCNYWYPGTIFEILCVYVAILALLQIPIRVALYKIRTIDAMDDDLL